jgi:hypothetical protein
MKNGAPFNRRAVFFGLDLRLGGKRIASDPVAH